MKLVVLDGYTLNPGDLNWEGIKKFGDLEVHDRTPESQIVERCQGAEIIFTNKTPLREAILSQLPDLKYIGVLATGYNVVDVDYAKTRGVVVANVPGYGTASVVQMTFALLLELCQHVQSHSDSVRQGDWAASPDFCYWNYPLIELEGKTIGIIGFGSIGQKVADIATAFGMNIIGFSRTRSDQSHRKNFKWAELNELLKESDVVSVHCPLFPETQGIINKDSLRLMKRTAFFLNTSRGPLMVDQDLADALNEGIIAGAGIDVLSVEPPSADNPLFKAKNCLITPHIAWATKEARSRLMGIAENNLSSFLNQKPINIVNK
ncbi:MAG: glycerate dehydrogenase [Sphingobacteriales bacterium 17-39-43]|uniref:D-2-hydroxyacid dehydrogenase n=1 Tax=Daejeonella sp. TaxID=2805397 RepID=UPI000BCC674C|nr:D-2-hydroxyacid dehydrogenase [Daejeonella sp.]OYZ31475.1 MAG: glycerate dehydrogenase [Sphingobacteriales bacterium 16-39-50]OZA24719.1 MAG: glycerate dehydrogenase [Sphingobacteriales bacterium 17-39-43]HQS04679.1 D-2-hydroxyacid dehydrogenase [Daejeonella sp.]HQT22637.1 D-2-hydroxyacid dehydrogenase [Daejeonella sp.]HQT57673.1 D-2-hydroxyacid dehydrogenase [Daejeonella sp.]